MDTGTRKGENSKPRETEDIQRRRSAQIADYEGRRDGHQQQCCCLELKGPYQLLLLTNKQTDRERKRERKEGRMKQQKLSALFQPLPLAKPPPRNVPEDEEDDSDDDEDWDAPLSSLGKKPSMSSRSSNSNSIKPSTKLMSKKKKENGENTTKRKQKKNSPSDVDVLGPFVFVSALTAQKLGEKRKVEQPQQEASKKSGKQQPKATIPLTSTLESELPDSVKDNANSQVCKDKEVQTTGSASNDNDEMKARALSPTSCCPLDGEEHSEAMPKVDSTISSSSDNQDTHQDATKSKKIVRRRISSSAMDYHDPEASLEKRHPLSLIRQLIQRTTHGTRFPHARATTRKWKVPSWIRLDHPPTKIDCMTWDTMGCLLAVASENMIRIYDWDMVGAADNKGRNQRTRNKADPEKHRREEWRIPPVLTFRVPQPVASLAWNPHDMDQLAVGLRYVSGLEVCWTCSRIPTRTRDSHCWFLFHGKQDNWGRSYVPSRSRFGMDN